MDRIDGVDSLDFGKRAGGINDRRSELHHRDVHRLVERYIDQASHVALARPDINKVLGDFDVRYKRTSKEDWVATRENGDTIRLVGVNLQKGLVPDVRGMSLRDAIYLLENSGLRVKYSGKGRVLRQSPEHGARVYEGSVVSLDMNM